MGSKNDAKSIDRLLKLAKPMQKNTYEELERLMAPFLDRMLRGEEPFLTFLVVAGLLFRGEAFPRYIQANVPRDIREAEYLGFQQVGAGKTECLREALIGDLAA